MFATTYNMIFERNFYSEATFWKTCFVGGGVQKYSISLLYYYTACCIAYPVNLYIYLVFLYQPTTMF